MSTTPEVYEVEVESQVTVVENETKVVQVTQEAESEIHIDIVDSTADQVSITPQAFQVIAVAGDVYFGDLEEDLITGIVKFNEFTVLEDGQTDFYISAEARKLLHVMINQIDYVDDCEINPIGSGRVRYTVPEGGYVLEAGDRAYVYWTL